MGLRVVCIFAVAAAARLHVQENYVNHKPAIASSEEMHMKVQGPTQFQEMLNLLTVWLNTIHASWMALHC